MHYISNCENWIWDLKLWKNKEKLQSDSFLQVFFREQILFSLFCNYFFLKLMCLSIYLCLLAILLYSGEVMNVKTGPEFFVEEVRGHQLHWYAYVAIGIVSLCYWFVMQFLDVSLIFLQISLFSMFFFNRTKLCNLRFVESSHNHCLSDFFSNGQTFPSNKKH